MKKTRLDLLLVEQGLAPSREKAQALVLAGQVLINEQKASKPGKTVPSDSTLRVLGMDHPYVSRGGVKLENALKAFDLTPTDVVALDVGASTGGFTDCLLQHGAQKVFAVDVGYGQLAWLLQQDDRVVMMDRTNIRTLDPTSLGEQVDWVVIDASFISLKHILPHTLPFLKEAGTLLALVKPQFEAGKHAIGKRGKVEAPEVHEAILEDLENYASAEGYDVLGRCSSGLPGKKSGNTEFFLWLKRRS